MTERMILDEPTCPKCGNRKEITRAGNYYYGLFKKERLQKFQCQKCGKIFTERSRHYNTRFQDEVVEYVVGLLKQEKKREEIQRSVYELFKIKITRETITSWKQKFIPRPYAEARDMEVRRKVVDAIFETMTYEELARLSGVRQSTLRNIFYTFVNKKLPPEVMDRRVLALRMGILNSKVEKNMEELKGLTKSFSEVFREEEVAENKVPLVT